MSTDPSFPLAARVRTLQLSAAALPLGVLVFAVVVLVLPAARPEPPRPPIVTWIGVLLAAAQVIVSTILPTLIAASARRRLAGQTDDSLWAAVYQTRLIVRLALLEGPALLLLIAYLLEGTVLSLALTAMLLALMLLHFPTEARVRDWIQSQKDLADSERLQAG